MANMDDSSADSESTETAALDPYSPDLGDWRLHFTGWTILPTDASKTPRAARMMTHRESESDWVSFFTPNACALHLNIAWKAAVRATAAKGRLKWNKEPMQFASFGQGQKAGSQLSEESIEDLFEFFEEAMVTVTSSFAALEAFANLTIVDRSTGPVTVTLQGKVKTLDVQEIERRVSTGQKLDELVPPLLGIASPSSLPEWTQFKRLQIWRDSITHFKRRDMASTKSEATVLHHLIDLRPLEAPVMAEALLKHFHGTTLPRYMVLSPWQKCEAQCLAIEAGASRA